MSFDTIWVHAVAKAGDSSNVPGNSSGCIDNGHGVAKAGGVMETGRCLHPRAEDESEHLAVFNERRRKMVLWVFGYGSLIWNPGFEFDEKMIGFIKDYRRVFDLGGSSFPSLFIPLSFVCLSNWICVSQEGDPRHPTVTGVLAFVSTPDKEANGYYLGPAPLQDMARQIATARGPCGNNRDYLFRLERALFDIGHEDDMVIELADEVRKVLLLLQEKAAPPAAAAPVSSPLLMYLSPLTETAAVDSR
ncbi:hypothetical protein BHE74_00029723 [Ensete ventricosum]|nr:hypothetical protein BHE74_00029723 [Ensete ventricosum]